MARRLYGATPADFTMTATGKIIPNVTATVWTARTGGTQVTDLLDYDGNASTVATSTADGLMLFYGPDGQADTYWLATGTGTRLAVRPVDLTGGPGVVAADAPLVYDDETETLSLDVGTTTGTVAAGDDARLSDERTPSDDSVTTAKIVDGAVTPAKLSTQSVLRALPTPLHPAEALLSQAVWWIDAQHSSASQQTISNLGTGGSALDATAGSTKGAWVGDGFIGLPGVAGNYLSVPDEAALDITGDIDIRVHVAMDDWTPGANQILVSKAAAGDYAFNLYLLTSGTPAIYWSQDGTSVINRACSASAPFSDGQVGWLRVTLDADNGSGAGTWRFYTSTDGSTWTQLGVDANTTGVASIHASNQSVQVGQYGTANNPLAGKVYQTQVYDGIDGTKVLDIDAARASTSSSTFGAVTGQTVTINTVTDSNDPKFLDWLGANYAYLPGVAGNYLSVAADDAPSPTDVDLRAQVALDDWTPASASAVICKGSGVTNRVYLLYVNTTGALGLQWRDETGLVSPVLSTVATGITDGATAWIRGTMDHTTGDVKFYTSADGSTWTQLGATVSRSSNAGVVVSSQILEVGTTSVAGSELLAAKVYRAQVFDGIDGTKVLDIDTSLIASGADTEFSARTGQTVTINRSTSGRKSVAVTAPQWLFGTDDYMEVPDNDLLDFDATQSFTVLGVVRSFGAWQDRAGLLSKRLNSGNYDGWEIGEYGTNELGVGISDGTTPIASQHSWTAGELIVLGGALDRSDDTLTGYVNGVGMTPADVTGIGSLETGLLLAVGRRPTGAFSDMQAHSFAVWRRALTADEITTLSDYFAGRIA